MTSDRWWTEDSELEKPHELDNMDKAYQKIQGDLNR